MTRKPALSTCPTAICRLAGDGSGQTRLDPFLQGAIACYRKQQEQGEWGDLFQVQDLRRLFAGDRNATFPPNYLSVLDLVYCLFFFFFKYG